MTRSAARRVASELHRRGLAVPARLLADAHRPMAPLLADLGAATEPVLSALGAPIGGLLDDEGLLDTIIGELDALDASKSRDVGDAEGRGDRPD